MANAKICCRAAKVNGKLAVEFTKTLHFGAVKNAEGPTAYFIINVEIPDEVLRFNAPEVNVSINPADIHLIVGQASLPRLAEAPGEAVAE